MRYFILLTACSFFVCPGTSGQTLTQHSTEIPAGYVLGPGDVVAVRVVGVDEIADKPIPVDVNGYIHLPLIGMMKASDSTLEQLAAEMTKRLSTYVLHPDVSVSVVEFRSQPVSVLGAVRNPGVQQVQGRKTLLEMISLAGGLDMANAGATLKITRRKEWGAIPLPNASSDPDNQFSIAELSVKSLLAAQNPAENILIKPYDVISIPRADTIYVIGEVPKAGGFLLTDSPNITVLQALAMAGGFDKMAQPKNARILRRVSGEPERREIPVNLAEILRGRTEDVRMQADDILFVPNDVPKRAAVRAVEAAVQMTTGIVIWRRP